MNYNLIDHFYNILQNIFCKTALSIKYSEGTEEPLGVQPRLKTTQYML